MQHLHRITIAALTATALSGCAALNSTAYKFSGPPGERQSRVVTVDDGQRHLIMVEDEDGLIRACTEPDRDTFSAQSGSISALFNFSGSNNEGKGSGATSETVASLERTQTVNLIRQSFYETCMRWLSGAITKNQFVSIAARDHRSMVAILAVEQLTGVVKAPSTIVNGPAVNAAIAQSEEAAKLLEEYRKERVAAETPYNETKAAYAAINTPFPTPSPTPTPTPTPTAGGAPKPTPSPTLSPTPKPLCEYETAPDGAAENYAKCGPAKEARDTAKTKYDTAVKRENSVLEQLENLSSGIAAATKGGQNDQGGFDGVENGLSDVQMALIGPTIEKIALYAGIDEALMFCIGYLEKPNYTTANSTREACNQIVLGSAAADKDAKEQIGGFRSEAAAQIFGNINRANLAEAQTQQTRIRLAIANKVFATPNAVLLERTKAFDEALKLGGILTQFCTDNPTPVGCGNAIVQLHPFSGEALSGRVEELEEALKAWKTTAN